jgi:hypothetical protein
LLNEVVWSEGWVSLDKHVYVTRHHVEAFDLNAKFIILLIEKFAESLLDLIFQYFSPVLRAKDDVVGDVVDRCVRHFPTLTYNTTLITLPHMVASRIRLLAFQWRVHPTPEDGGLSSPSTLNLQS